ncbi:hypothetical protein [Streptomyces carpaticus]|uniref:hypothetical protein n=1 Tax=Streptomyces carpaticus TaxID=285558 RepID=UPI0035C17A5C
MTAAGPGDFHLAPAERPSRPTGGPPAPSRGAPGTAPPSPPRRPPGTASAVPPRPAAPPAARPEREPGSGAGADPGFEDDSHPTLLLRAVAPRPHPLRIVAVVIALVLGAGLLGGAAAGAWLTGDSADSAARAAFDDSRALWRDLPVDELFPPELHSEGAGPGGAERRWLRVAVAPDTECATALGEELAGALLSGTGCERAVRASYVDDTVTSVTTVGMVFTDADPAATEALAERFATGGLGLRADLMPATYPGPGTAAETFGAAQRATWTVRVLTDAPVIVYAVTGFADGRTADAPQAATEAVAEGQDTVVALAGLGHEAMGVADQIERNIRQAADRFTEEHG